MVARGGALPRRPAPEERGPRRVAGSARRPAAARLERLIHEQLRLAILSALAVNDALGFTDLRDLLGTSDGNLSVHARKLEEAGYITSHKIQRGKAARTEFRLAAAGRAALDRYLGHMEAIIRAVRRP